MNNYQPSADRYDKMQYKYCGKSGLLLPRISLGLWHNFGSVDDFGVATDMIKYAFDNGVTHFDLANNYGPVPGSAESNFGKILKENFQGYRDEMIISSKAGHDMWSGPYGDGSSRKNLMASIDQSLRRTGLEYFDIFYSHRYDGVTPVEETIDGKSEYGCDLTIRFHLNVYPDVVAGSIAKEEVDCPESPLSITKLINVTSASGGDPSAHYQWQRSDSESGPWTDVEGQTGDSYTVTQPGYYRRAYLSEDCEAECYKGYTDYVYVAQAGSFNPGTHIDGTEEICHGSTLADARILGGDMENSSILHDANGYHNKW